MGSFDVALQDFATILADRFLRNSPKDRQQIFEAFASDHATRV
jgi:hypothetical protein